MQKFLGVCFVFAPALILLWAIIRSLRLGKFPVFWWIITVNRESHPRVYVGLMALMIIATAFLMCVSVAIAVITIREPH
jgi:hypothetical protein